MVRAEQMNTMGHNLPVWGERAAHAMAALKARAGYKAMINAWPDGRQEGTS